MATQTPNYNLTKPDPNTDYYNIEVHNNNADIIDAALKPAADPALVPTGLTGKLTQWVSWIANRIKAITGKPNWYDNPATTLEDAKTHADAAAPHSGHETPDGAQAKANAAEAAANAYTDQEVGAVASTLGSHEADSVTDADGAHGLKTEEGTWTPYFTGDETSNNNVYAEQTGKYYKTGKLVIVEFVVNLTTKDGMSGTFRIRGLPFSARWGNYQAGNLAYIEKVNYEEGEFLTLRRGDFSTGLSFSRNAKDTAPTSFSSTRISDGTRIAGTFTYTAN